MIKVKVFTNSLQNSMNKREKFKFIPKGYLEVEEFDKDEAWNLLNWSNHTKEQPKETLNTEVSTCCSGILLQEEGQEAFYSGLKAIESVKFVFLKSTKLNKEILAHSKELKKNQYVYFQLSKHCLICNNINK